MKKFFGKADANEIRSYIQSKYSGKQLEINNGLLNEIVEYFNFNKIEAFNPHPVRKGRNNIYHVLYSDVFYNYFTSADKPNTFVIERKGKTSAIEFGFDNADSAISFLQALTGVKNTLKNIKIIIEQ